VAWPTQVTVASALFARSARPSFVTRGNVTGSAPPTSAAQRWRTRNVLTVQALGNLNSGSVLANPRSRW
jgi:hypothetical protein